MLGEKEDMQEDMLALEEIMKSGLAWSPRRKLAWPSWSPERDGLYLWKSPGESRETKTSRHGVENCSLGTWPPWHTSDGMIFQVRSELRAGRFHTPGPGHFCQAQQSQWLGEKKKSLMALSWMVSGLEFRPMREAGPGFRAGLQTASP